MNRQKPFGTTSMQSLSIQSDPSAKNSKPIITDTDKDDHFRYAKKFNTTIM